MNYSVGMKIILKLIGAGLWFGRNIILMAKKGDVMLLYPAPTAVDTAKVPLIKNRIY